MNQRIEHTDPPTGVQTQPARIRGRDELRKVIALDLRRQIETGRATRHLASRVNGNGQAQRPQAWRPRWRHSLRLSPCAAAGGEERHQRNARATLKLGPLLVAVTVLLTASAVLITTRPGGQPPRRASRTPATPAVHAQRQTARTDNATRVAPLAARVAHRFLTGYLAYLYGHAPARAITAATPSLLRSLRARPPLVSPAMRARRPRVLALRPMPASAGAVDVSVLIGDGELADYSIGLLLKREHRQLLVSGVEEN